MVSIMTRSMFPGATDYRHQTFFNLIEDLEEWIELLTFTNEKLASLRSQLIEENLWPLVLDDFRGLIDYSIVFYNTCLSEINEIMTELKLEVQQHHVGRLNSLSKTAKELDGRFGNVWHRDDSFDRYGAPYSRAIEAMYAEGRGMAIDLYDLSNLSLRLNDFLGKRHPNSLRQSSEVDLHKAIEATFDLNELESLCDDLRINYQNIPGTTLNEKIRGLVAYANRRGILEELVDQCKLLRPKANWD